jgi:hypothetical protein
MILGTITITDDGIMESRGKGRYKVTLGSRIREVEAVAFGDDVPEALENLVKEMDELGISELV